MNNLSWYWVDYLEQEINFVPMYHVTLTFRDVDTSPQKAWNAFKKWVHEINLNVVGRNYKNKFKHSYFSYVVVEEYQRRGTIHFHVLIDSYIPFNFARLVWWNMFGFIKIVRVNNVEASVRYILKYVTKENQPIVWLVQNRVNIEVLELNKAADWVLSKSM